MSIRSLAVGTMLAGVLTATGVASAADLARKAPAQVVAPLPAFSWTGCYIGGNAGGSFNNSSLTSGPNPGAPFTGNLSSFDLNGAAGVAGVQYGCNRQVTPNIVLGFDSSFDWSGLSESVAFSNPAGGGRSAYAGSVTQNLDWLSTTGARIGWTQDRWMVFASGGLASGKIKSSYSDYGPANGLAFIGGHSTTRYGWTVGGGVEYALTPNWFLRGEYLYVDLGKMNYRSPANTIGSGAWLTEVDTQAHIARVALTYRLTTAGSWLEWAAGGFK